MNASPEVEVRRRVLKRDAIKGILMLAGIELIRTAPLLGGSAKRLGLSPVPSAADFVVSFVIGLVLGTVLTNRYLKVEGQRPKMIKISSTKFNWAAGIIVGTCAMLGSFVFDACLHFSEDDLVNCFPLKRMIDTVGTGITGGIFAWIYHWSRGFEKDGSGELVLEIYSVKKRSWELVHLVGVGLFILLIAFVVFYKIFTMK